MPNGYDDLMNYALRIISKKRYTVSEMRKKLGGFLKRADQRNLEDEEDGGEERQEGDGLELVGRVLERLEELNYLNDLEYTRSYISDRSRFRPRGKIMIQRELMARGVKKEDIKKIFSEESENETYSEISCAEDLIKRKERAWENLDLKKKRERAYRFLQSKGFGRDTIYKALRSCYSQVTE